MDGHILVTNNGIFGTGGLVPAYAPVVVSYKHTPEAWSLSAAPTVHGSIALSWTNAGEGAAGYQIRRAANTPDFSSNDSVLANVRAGVSSYEDAAVSGNSTYYYEVM